ncbi:hypothetical protein KBC75_02780 [Candidatus Shapirobacteria bacterium]|nr:hypothetical protein [Candidatus Shapirobacteria bacterium]
MTTDEQIILELQKLNTKIDRYTHPLKSIGNSFLTGLFHSLGSLFGTVVIAGLVVYVFSSVNFPKLISKFMEDSMSQINWSKIVPTPAPIDLQQYLQKPINSN